MYSCFDVDKWLSDTCFPQMGCDTAVVLAIASFQLFARTFAHTPTETFTVINFQSPPFEEERALPAEGQRRRKEI
jgi:hypothetical protein